MTIDWSGTATDYARYRAGFPDEFYERLAGYEFIGRNGESRRCLDLGTGTGALARGFARRGWRVTGIDTSADMMQAARHLDAAAGVEIDYAVANAEATGQPDASFDMVAAATCWHWFDRARAAREARRVLVDRGALVICAMDWSEEPGNIIEATTALIAQHNPAWLSSGGSGLRFAWADELTSAGFMVVDRFRFTAAVPYSHAAWRGRIRASAGVAPSMSPEAVAAFDRAHAALLQERFPAEPLQVPHRISAILARRASA